MGDLNPICTLGDYFKPSHEGYKNTIELPVGNNVDYKTPQRNPDVSTTLWRITLRSMDSFQGLTPKITSSWHRSLDPNVLSTSDRRIIKLENQVQRLMEAHLALTQPTQVNKITSSCKICSDPHNTQYRMENPKQAFFEYVSSRTDKAGGEVSAKMEDPSLQDPGLFTLPCRLGDSKPFDTLADLGSCVNIIPLYLFKKLHIGLLEEIDHIFRLADGTKSYPVGIVKDVEVYIGKLKLLNDFYVIYMKKDPETPLLVGRGFLATAIAVIDCRIAKIAVGEGITSSDGLGAQTPYYARKDFLDCYLPREWEIARDAKINSFKDILVFRRMVEFLRALPINLKRNMWELEDLIDNPINWDKLPKDGDGAWHAKIRIIDPDGEEFTKTLQSVPTTRKLSERESPKEIINLDHFYET
ncbi:MAK10-like protein [Tanacetum coccineum]